MIGYVDVAMSETLPTMTIVPKMDSRVLVRGQWFIVIRAARGATYSFGARARIVPMK
jgi:hypothetical protein